LFLARLPGILANSNENYGCYNFQSFANIFGKFPEVLNFWKIDNPICHLLTRQVVRLWCNSLFWSYVHNCVVRYFMQEVIKGYWTNSSVSGPDRTSVDDFRSYTTLFHSNSTPTNQHSNSQ